MGHCRKEGAWRFVGKAVKYGVLECASLILLGIRQCDYYSVGLARVSVDCQDLNHLQTQEIMCVLQYGRVWTRSFERDGWR